MSTEKIISAIEGATVWRANDFADSRIWAREFSREEISEIESATNASRKLPIADISEKTFSLPALGSVLSSVRRQLIDGRGFVLMRGLPVERWSREETARAYWGLGAHIGQPVSQNPEGHLLGHVKDIGGDFHDLNSRGGYRSRAQLPFHTDVGADVVGLLCLRAAKSRGYSSLVSVGAIYNAMREQRPDLVELLAQPIHRDRRGEVPPGRDQHYRAPVFCLHEGRLTTTFVRRFIDTAPRHDGVPALPAKLVEALDLFEEIANDPDLRLDMNFAPGDIQFVNNLTTLHARTDFEDFDDPDRKRHLLRLWLAVTDGWPLPDYYFERFGAISDSGRPAGMAMPGVTPTVPLDVV